MRLTRTDPMKIESESIGWKFKMSKFDDSGCDS